MALPQPTIQYNPQQNDPLSTVGKLVSMRNLMQQGQIQQETLQADQLENQQRQMQVNDQKIVRDAFVKNNGDPDKTLQDAARAGVSPATLQQLQLHAADLKSKNLDLVNKQGEKALRDADLMKGAYDTLVKTPPEQRAQVYPQLLQGLQQAQVDTSQMSPQYPGDDHLPLLGALVQGHAKGVEEAAKQAGIAKDVAQTAEATATAKKTNLEADQLQKFGGTPQMQESRYRFVLGKMAAKQPVDPDDMAAAIAYEASNRKTTTQSDSLGVTSTNTSAPSGLAAFKKGGGGQGTGAAPAGKTVKDSIVDLVGQYRADPQLLGRMLYKHPEIVGMIQQKYPDFDQTTYVAKNKLIQGYTSGGQSKEINAINTVASHLSILNDAVDALNNGDLKLLNGIANKLGVAVGQTPQSTFKTIVHRVGPEITTAYVQGGGGEAERFANAQDFSENNAPQQLKQNTAVTVKLLRGKIGALENQYKNTVGRDDFQQRFITPDAQKAFQALAPTPTAGGGGFSVKAPNGKTYSFKDQQSLNAFKQKAGIQ